MAILNTELNDLQLYRTRYFSDLVEENMLSQALLTRPHEVSTMLSYIFGMKEQTSVLDFLTGGMGKTMVVENREYDWNVMIEADKPVTIKAAKWQGSTISSTDVPGINGTPFQVWVSEKFFGPGAIVEFDDNEFQARVMGEPYQDGHDWVYTLQVADGQPESYISPSLLAAGKQISRAGSAYEEYSDEADIVTYQAPIKLRNQLTTMRLKYDITGSAYSSVLIVAMRDPKTGKSSYLWSDWQEWLALRQWYKTLDYQLVYDKSTAKSDGTSMIKGTNGRPVYRGAGLRQQIAPANKQTYTTLTANILEDFLFAISYNRKGMGERKYVALTGEMGMKELDRVLRTKAAGLGVTLLDTKFISGSGQELVLGGQFVTYRMLNGVELTLKHFPLYDDTYHHRKLHPVSGFPVESYRMTFLDFGTMDGDPNIVKVVRKGREMVMWTEAGAVAPGQGFGQNVSTLRANGRDGYVVYILSECSIMIKNPAACGELILDAD